MALETAKSKPGTVTCIKVNDKRPLPRAYIHQKLYRCLSLCCFQQLLRFPDLIQHKHSQVLIRRLFFFALIGVDQIGLQAFTETKTERKMSPLIHRLQQDLYLAFGKKRISGSRNLNDF